MSIGMSEETQQSAISGSSEVVSLQEVSCRHPKLALQRRLSSGCYLLKACSANGLISPSLTSQLFLIGHIALNKQSLLRFKLLIQGSFTLDTCFEIPIDQRYLQTKGEESRSFICLIKQTDRPTMQRQQEPPRLDLRSGSLQIRFSAGAFEVCWSAPAWTALEAARRAPGAQPGRSLPGAAAGGRVSGGPCASPRLPLRP